MDLTLRQPSQLPWNAHGRSPEQAAPRIFWLRGGGAETFLTSSGAGYFAQDNLAVTRWAGDPTCDADGIFLYLRDLDDGRYWSAGFQPTAIEPDSYDVQFRPGLAIFRRVDAGIQVQLEVCVGRETGQELRRITLENLTGRRRRIEITSYLEWVLQDAAADAAHPAFSKLFVETSIDDARQMIVARRRCRDERDRTLAAAHWMIDAEQRPACEAAVQYETSRMAFLGRGGSVRRPAALMRPAPLSGSQGPVLDPVASIRRTVFLAPGESATTVFALLARQNPLEMLAATQAVTLELVGEAFQQAKSAVAIENGHSAERRLDAPHTAPLERPPHADRLRETVDNSAGEVELLQFDNGLGGFTADGREYVIRLRPDAAGGLLLPPAPWSHVVANPQAGFIATETGAGCTWTVNSRENRLTHWGNDPVCDPHSEALYLRDRQRQVFWSPTPGPAGPNVPHEVRYGSGYARYAQTSAELEQQTLQFVPWDDPVKVIRVSLQNKCGTPRELDVFFYAHLALGNGARRPEQRVRTWLDAQSGAVFATNSSRELAGRCAFVALVNPGAAGAPSFTGQRLEFLGRYGDLTSPAAVRGGRQLSGRGGTDADSCAALQSSLQLTAYAAADYWVLLGEAADEAEARTLIARYSTTGAVAAAFDEIVRRWRHVLSAVEIETPSAAMDLMVNGWLPYQNMSCRLWGRSAYYQSGGAFGFRDQLQDSAALVYHQPELTREQILRHAGAQFAEGDVLHWWHPPGGRGIRTRFADDLLWLPLVAAEYVDTTGDRGVWDEQIAYLTGPQLAPGEAERFCAPSIGPDSGSVYDHACRAVDRSLATGMHGLPLMGCGDWNDGMNRVGAGGRGESVWMAFFLHLVLERMIPVCVARGDDKRAGIYGGRQESLRQAIDEHGWDGEWFRRAYFDDGAPLGSAADAECQIDALVQAWAVLSGAARPDRTLQGIAAVESRLVRSDVGIIQLLDPPFDRSERDPGYIKGYLPGIRENGGQYTHGVLWFIRAVAELGCGARAVELLDMINPIHHARTPEEVAVYQVEPYVVAADVYSQPPHAGRGGWTWYTGSAGWMFRVAVESILGLSVRGGAQLVLNPCISDAWPRATLRYREPTAGGVYEIVIENPACRETGVRTALVDGQPATIQNGAAIVPLIADGKSRRVLLQL